MKENIEAIFPLTPMQHGMLFHSVMDKEQHAYFQQVNCEFDGKVKIQLLKETWTELINRHEVLRSVFIWKHEKDPVQVVLKKVNLPIEFLDWKTKDETSVKKNLEALLLKDRSVPFDVSKAPLMRLIIVELPNAKFQMIWSHHHILIDGWSTGLLFEEFQQIYTSKSKGIQVSLASVLPYKNYVSWLNCKKEEETKSFWQNYLKGIESTTAIPRDRGIVGLESLEYRHSISTTLTQQITGFASQQQITPNVLFLSVWSLLLSKYQSEEEVVLGITVSGRPEELVGIENRVGLFINSLPIRINTSKETSVKQWCKEVQNNLLSIREFEHTSLSKIKEWSSMDTASPLFESLFVYENYPISGVANQEFEGIKLTQATIYERTNFPLTIVVEPQQDGTTQLKFLYQENRIYTKDIEQLIENYLQLLTNFTAQEAANKNVQQIPLVSKAQEDKINNQWNNTATSYNEEITMHQLFEAQCKRTPKHTAIVDDNGTLNYTEVNSKANQIAHTLINSGLKKGEYVAVFFNRSKEMIPALLGILKAGGVYVPIEVSTPVLRIEFILSSMNIRFALSQEHNVAPLLRTALLKEEHIICLNKEASIINKTNSQLLVSETQTNPELQIDAANYAYVIFTSGTTGTPKGVTVAHKPVINLIEWVTKKFTISSEDQVLLVSSLSFDLSIYDIFGLLAAGGSIRVASDEAIKNPSALVSYILEEPITFWDSAPAALQQLVPFLPEEKVNSKLRLVFQSGDWIPVSLPTKMKQVFPNLTFVSLGGATEATVWSNYFVVNKLNPKHKSIPYGRPIQNAKYYILDQYKNNCPPGVPGDLYIGGECLSSLYANAPELTAQKFVSDPFSSKEGARMYFTGDKASFYPDGNIEFLGRIDDQVKVRGFRIELGEIQSIINKHQAISTAITLVKKDNAGFNQIVVYYTPVKNTKVSEEELKDWLTNYLPSYMIPSTIIEVANFPITANGKLDRKALPDPIKKETQKITTNDKPVTFIEEIIWNNWNELLGVAPESFETDFFEVGGHSLLATRFVARLRAALSVEVPIQSIFEHTTPKKLSAYLEQLIRKESEENAVLWETTDKEQFNTLSFAQERLWFLHQLKPESSFYNVPLTIRIKGTLGIEALQEAVKNIVQRHTVLRSIYSATEATVGVQKIQAVDTIPWEVVDLSLCSDKALFAMEYLKKEAQKPFNLKEGSIVRALLLKISETETIFQLTTHHIVIDGWSIGILIKELEFFYNNYKKESNTNLQPLNYQYADYALWQKNYIEKKVLTDQLKYWKDHLYNFNSLDLPVKEESDFSQQNATFRASVGVEFSKTLRAFSQKNNCTLFMSLLTAFNIQLYATTKQEDIVVGTDMANRGHINTEKLIGFFVNQIVLRNSLANNPTCKSLLKQIRTNTLLAYQNQDVPFEKLVQHLNPERNANKMPFFQTKIVLQNNSVEELSLEGLEIEPIEIAVNDSKYDLLWTFDDTEDIAVRIEYKTGLFTEVKIQKWWNQFHMILHKMVDSTAFTLNDFVTFLDKENVKNKDKDKRRAGLLKLRSIAGKRESVTIIEKNN